MLKLALRNLRSKPFRTVATVLAIAVAVALIFCMLSFKGAVFDYIYASETAVAGRSDIRIATTSSSSQLLNITAPIGSMEEVEGFSPSLRLYAMLGDEYVQVRGFDNGKLEFLQDIDVIDGSIDTINDGTHTDNIVISQAAAEHFGLYVGDRVELALGSRKIPLIIGAISSNSGYFLDDAPYQFLGLIKQISGLLIGGNIMLCDEIYLRLTPDADINAVIEKLSRIPAYEQMQIRQSKDAAYVEEQTDSLTAPVVLAGAAVLLLAVACVAMLFLMSEKEKVALIAKLSVVGATKKQMLAIFLLESGFVALIGSVVGIALASGIFLGLLKLTLSSTLVFGVSAIKLIGSAMIGFAVSIISAIAPILRSFKGSIRENQINLQKKPLWQKILPVALVVLTLISIIIEFSVPSALAYASVVSLVLILLTLGVCLPICMRAVANLSRRSNTPSVKIASVAMSRQKRFARSVTMLGVGMTVSMMLFMAWSLTTNVFDAYISDFANMAFVTNIRANTDISQFTEIDGVSSATKLVWKQSTLKGGKFEKTMNVLGSADTLDMVNFEFITPKDEVKAAIASGQPYIVVDVALRELYGVSAGDRLIMDLEDTSCEVIVAGIVKHNLFSGNYVIMSSGAIEKYYGIQPDTVLVICDGDIKSVVDNLRAGFADKNYYVVETLEAYRWDRESMGAVFDLIGTLAIVVAVFILIVTVAAATVGRTAASRDRTALLNAGMSKKTMLAAETFEHGMIALISYVISFAVSALLTACLIHALRLFGLYFEFMYEAWVVAVVGAVMATGFAIVPVALNFKKGYNINNRNK